VLEMPQKSSPALLLISITEKRDVIKSRFIVVL
jgi:hypothetical protein